MMHITQLSTSTIALTLTEKCTLTAPVFLFRFIHCETLQEFACICNDVSGFPTRFNQFAIIEKVSAETLSNEIHLPIQGAYYYHIYEQESTTNLDWTLALAEVENGKLLVHGTPTVIEEYTGEQTEDKVYNG